MKSTPHFVLFSRTGEQPTHRHGGSWYFRLESTTSGDFFEASDIEFNTSRERLELLSVVRGLEALDQPSSVTLVTSSRQVSRAVRQGLEYWRVRDWKWERFGEKVPMKNGDLWKRIDGALRIHEVRCRTFRLDRGHEVPAPMLSKHSHELRTDAAMVAVDRNAKQSQRRPGVLFRPFVWGANKAANAMHLTANTLQRLVPDSPSPHLT